MAATLGRVAALSRTATGHGAGDWAGSEIAAALTWSESKAARELDFADDLSALPLVAAAFDAGSIDHGKALVFTDVLTPAPAAPEAGSPADTPVAPPATGPAAAPDAESPAGAPGGRPAPRQAAASDSGSPADAPHPQRTAPVRPAGVEIRVGLATLLGLDQRPGDIPGWGPVLPQVARDLVSRYRHAPWRFAVVDDEGYLLLAGSTPRRPTPSNPAAVPAAVGGVVELHVTATLLATLAHDPGAHPQWAAVIGDIAARFGRRRQLRNALDARPHSRHARGPLLRHLQIRDRTCVVPGCRRPARTCDADHTFAYTDGGATTVANVGPLCPRHHALKHRAGWRLRQPRPGHFAWHSPLGRCYTTRGEPIMPPLPEPRPGPTLPPPPDGPSREVGTPTFEARPRPHPPGPTPRRGWLWSRRPPEDPDDPAPF